MHKPLPSSITSITIHSDYLIAVLLTNGCFLSKLRLVLIKQDMPHLLRPVGTNPDISWFPLKFCNVTQNLYLCLNTSHPHLFWHLLIKHKCVAPFLPVLVYHLITLHLHSYTDFMSDQQILACHVMVLHIHSYSDFKSDRQILACHVMTLHVHSYPDFT